MQWYLHGMLVLVLWDFEAGGGQQQRAAKGGGADTRLETSARTGKSVAMAVGWTPWL